MNELYKEILPLISSYQKEFLDIELGRGFDIYRDRIRFIGLNGHERVLDAGGGIGQWAMALAENNREVHVLDISSERLFIGRHIASKSGIKNIFFQYGCLEKLPYEDASFDVLICYSVFMFADSELAIKEFNRVLKPGGKLYVMVDLWKWYLDMIIDRKMSIRQSIIFLIKKVFRRTPKFFTSRSFSDLVSENGFKIIREGQDGESYFGNDTKIIDPSLSFYKTEAKERLWEVCALRAS